MILQAFMWAVQCTPLEGRPYYAAHTTALAMWKDREKWLADQFAQKLQAAFSGTVEVVRVKATIARVYGPQKTERGRK